MTRPTTRPMTRTAARSTTRTIAVLAFALGAAHLGPLAPVEAQARAESGVCSVFKGNNKIDENSCLAREICYYNETRRSQLCRTEYLWPTNATTLVTYDASGRATLVNGAPARARTIGGRTCALNTVSGNTFCYSRR